MRDGAFASPVCAVSAHLDDAVLSCAQLLAARPGAVVVTVFAGAPRSAFWPTGWNATTTRRRRPRAALAERIQEDDRALADLGARGIRLGFWDGEYRWRVGPPVGRIAARLRSTLAQLRPATILVPLGVGHADHAAASMAGLVVAGELAWSSATEVYLYADRPYDIDRPGEVVARLDRIGAMQPEGGSEPVEVGALRAGGSVKVAAVARYASQVGVLSALHPGWAAALAAPERYWRLGADRVID